ncbi:MAG: DNA polymerase III subunit beta [Eubacteriales bacterium]|nr:DNA polymerase III subunit beta [Eubacteriales bacterium]
MHSPYYYYYIYITTTAYKADEGSEAMHIIINASEINRAFSLLMKAIQPKPPQTVFEGVFMETVDEGIMLTTTNGQLTVKTQVNATVEKDGSCLVPARLFSELVRKLDGEIELETKKGLLKISALGMSSTDIVSLEAAAFPQIEDVKNGFSVSVKHKDFSNAVNKTKFALSSELSQMILTGCFIQVFPEEVRIVCLDGFRLAMQKLYVQSEIPKDKEYISCIVPGDVIKELSSMAGEEDGDIKLTFNSTNLMAEFNSTKVYSPLIVGEYIDYEQILPKTWTTEIKVDRSRLIQAIERSAIIAREGNNLLRLNIEDDSISISANTEKANSLEKMPISKNGKELLIAFNSRYLLDVVNNVEGKEFTMRFNTNVSPCVVSPVKGNQFTYLVLPVRTIEAMEA